jgi:FKBP-type peptidyl-prolyl cis-trans isomerase 2
MVFKDGDFLEVEYSSWNAADNSMIDTTDEKKAKENNAHVEGRKYGPALVVLGSPGVVKGLDMALREMSLDQTKKITLKPEEAFGERNPGIVKVMPLSEFKKRDISPYPGMRVNIDNVSATVKSVNSGRVVVDANHPYAGFDIIYEVKLLRQITALDDKIRALGRAYDVEPSSVSVEGKTATMRFSDSAEKDHDYYMRRAGLAGSVFGYFKELERVMMDEEYLRPKEAPESGGEKEDKEETAEGGG